MSVNATGCHQMDSTISIGVFLQFTLPSAVVRKVNPSCSGVPPTRIVPIPQPQIEKNVRNGTQIRGSLRPPAVLLLLLLAITQIPVVSAHDGAGTFGLSPWHGTLIISGGMTVLGGLVLLKRRICISSTTALYGVFLVLVATAFGTILGGGLVSNPTYTALTMPFPRSWYQPLSLVVGILIAVLRLVVGWLRWPTRPRYTFLGICPPGVSCTQSNRLVDPVDRRLSPPPIE